jgi:hypothetical protein
MSTPRCNKQSCISFLKCSAKIRHVLLHDTGDELYSLDTNDVCAKLCPLWLRSPILSQNNLLRSNVDYLVLSETK